MDEDTGGEAAGEAEPQERVCEEREDCAVLDFRRKTRLLFTALPVLELFDEVTAQFRGIELLLFPMAAGSEG